jgi:hypothetical protein
VSDQHTCRLALDAARARQKSVNGPRAEQVRLETEAAEETLVNATEEAIGLMRAVLENVGIILISHFIGALC